MGDRELGCIVTAYKDARSAPQFVDALRESLREIKAIIDASASDNKNDKDKKSRK